MEKKRTLLTNAAVIAALLALAVLIYFAAGQLALPTPNAGVLDGMVEAADPETAPETEGIPADEVPHARAYLLVTVADATYEPIPLTKAGRYTVTRGDHINIIEVTEDSVLMAESSCDNQDCVYQGVVSLDNKDQRVLRNMILCLPNEVVLELYTYEELLERLPGWQGGQGE